MFKLNTIKYDRLNAKLDFCGLFQDAEWAHYAWSLKINGQAFNYRTGIGHRLDRTNTRYGAPFNRKPKDKASFFHDDSDAWVFIPPLDDILGCLFSDAQAGSMSFYEFCNDLGYERDSIKALKTHLACQDNSEKLKKALGKEYQAEKERIAKLQEEGFL